MKNRRRATLFVLSIIVNLFAGRTAISFENHVNSKIKPNHLALPEFYGRNDNHDDDINSLFHNWRKHSKYDLNDESKKKIDELMAQAELLGFHKLKPPSAQQQVALPRKHGQHLFEDLPIMGIAEYSEEPNFAEVEDPPMEQKVVVVQTFSDPEKPQPSKTEVSVENKQEPAASKMIMQEENLQKGVDPKKIEHLKKIILLDGKTKLLRKNLEEGIVEKGDSQPLLKLWTRTIIPNNDQTWLQLKNKESTSLAQIYLLAVVSGCSVAAVACFILAGVCWYRHKKNSKSSKGEFPGYGITGPNLKDKASPGDRKLAQNAQMYHYQHQKQQMIASERVAADANREASEGESEEENEEGDFTVFECPGLATTREMEVENPMFKDSHVSQPNHETLNHSK